MARRDLTIIGSFNNRNEVIDAVRRLKEQGYNENGIILYANQAVIDKITNYQEIDVSTEAIDTEEEEERNFWQQIKDAFTMRSYDFEQDSEGSTYDSEEDILYPTRDEIRSGKIIVVVDENQNNNNKEEISEDPKHHGFGPDTVAADDDLESPDDNFNPDAIDPREIAADNVHSSNVTRTGMNTNPTGPSSTSSIENKTGDINSTNDELTTNDLPEGSDVDVSEREARVDSEDRGKDIRQPRRDDTVAEGYNREPVDYGVNADPTGRNFSPNVANDEVNVSPFNSNMDQEPIDPNENTSDNNRGKTTSDERKNLTEEVNPKTDNIDRGGDKPVDVKDFAKDVDDSTRKTGDDKNKKDDKGD